MIQRYDNNGEPRPDGEYLKVVDVRHLIADAERLNMLLAMCTSMTVRRNKGNVKAFIMKMAAHVETIQSARDHMRSIIDEMIDQYEQ